MATADAPAGYWKYLIHDGILCRMGGGAGGFPLERWSEQDGWEDFAEFYVDVVHDQRPITEDEANDFMARKKKFS